MADAQQSSTSPAASGSFASSRFASDVSNRSTVAIAGPPDRVGSVSSTALSFFQAIGRKYQALNKRWAAANYEAGKDSWPIDDKTALVLRETYLGLDIAQRVMGYAALAATACMQPEVAVPAAAISTALDAFATIARAKYADYLAQKGHDPSGKPVSKEEVVQQYEEAQNEAPIVILGAASTMLAAMGEGLEAVHDDVPAMVKWGQAMLGLDSPFPSHVLKAGLALTNLYLTWQTIKSAVKDAHSAKRLAGRVADWAAGKAEQFSHFLERMGHTAMNAGRQLRDMMKIQAPNDGELTGPFYPKGDRRHHALRTGLNPGAKPGEKAQDLQRAYSPRSRQSALADGAAVFVNGINTSLADHYEEGQRLSDQTGRVIVGVYNASGGMLRDLAQCLADKALDIGANPAVATLKRIIKDYGNPKSQDAGLNIYAHSQGSIIVSEALRQVRDERSPLGSISVTTFGNAMASIPQGLLEYHNYVFDSDLVPSSVGSSSMLGRLFSPIAAAMGWRAPLQDTTMLHSPGSFLRPHALMANDGSPDYISSLPAFQLQEKRDSAAMRGLSPRERAVLRSLREDSLRDRAMSNTAFAIARGIGAGAVDFAGGIYSRSRRGIAAGYGAAENMVSGAYAGLAGAVRVGFGQLNGEIASGYGRLDSVMRSMPSLPGLPANSIWGGIDSKLRWAGAEGSGMLGAAGSAIDRKARYFGSGLSIGARSYGGWLDQATRAEGGLIGGAGNAIGRAWDAFWSAGEPNAGSSAGILQKSALNGSGGHPEADAAMLRQHLRREGGAGFAPDTTLRERLSGTLGFDPGGARLHRGPEAAAAAKSLRAEAFTIGSDVFFGGGRFEPATAQGLGLIAHELTHVGQQTGALGDKTRFFTERGGDEMEREAQQAAERVLMNVGSAGGLHVDEYFRSYEAQGDGRLTKADQDRLDRISMMALQEAERMLGRRGGAHLMAVEVQVELDLDRLSDTEAAHVWAEALIRSVGDARRQPDNLVEFSAARAIQKWDSFEHVELGDTSGGAATPYVTLACYDKDFPQHKDPVAAWPKEWQDIYNGGTAEQKRALTQGLSYGEVVALSGDFYKNFEALNQAPLKEIINLIPLIRSDSATTSELQEATGGRYLALAKKNVSHFSNVPKGKRNIDVWTSMHQDAIAAAMRGDANLAWAMNAASDHFLTDAFSSGHVRTPRAALMGSSTGDLQSKVLHDLDNKFGVDVVNDAGYSYTAYGDDAMDDPRDTFNKSLAMIAVRLSKQDISDALAQGSAYKRPDPFAALRLVPRPVSMTKDRWTGRMNDPRLGLANAIYKKTYIPPWQTMDDPLDQPDLELTDYEQEIWDLSKQEGPGMLAAADTPIRKWVSTQDLAAIGREPIEEKIRMVDRLLSGWISDDDVDAIERICLSITDPKEMAAMKADVAPHLSGMFSLMDRQRKRVVAAVSRSIPDADASLSTDAQDRIARITSILSSLWITDAQVAEIERICAEVKSQKELDDISAAISPLVAKKMASSAQRARVRAALWQPVPSRTTAPGSGVSIQRSPLLGTPADSTPDETTATANQSRLARSISSGQAGGSGSAAGNNALAKIDVKATHIGGFLSSLPIWHLLIVTTDPSGRQNYYRGGPGGGNPPAGQYGYIRGTYGEYVKGTVDYDPSSPSVVAATGDDAVGKDDQLKSELARIESRQVPYSPFGPNSNTVASTLMRRTGIPRVKPVWVAPGWDDDDL